VFYIKGEFKMTEYETDLIDEQFGLDDLEQICRERGKAGQAVRVVNYYSQEEQTANLRNSLYMRTELLIDSDGNPVEFQEFHPDGAEKTHCEFWDGIRQYVSREFDEEGALVSRKHFVDSVQHGVQVTYTEGKLENFEIWERGEPRDPNDYLY
jgi:antitoxin component YwqK of YwqJK toxin-antitoxin module